MVVGVVCGVGRGGKRNKMFKLNEPHGPFPTGEPQHVVNSPLQRLHLSRELQPVDLVTRQYLPHGGPAKLLRRLVPDRNGKVTNTPQHRKYRKYRHK